MPKLIAKLIFGLIKLIFRDKTDLVLENLALRHQLSVLKRKKNPKFSILHQSIIYPIILFARIVIDRKNPNLLL